MAKKKWMVDFNINISTCRVIAADTKEEAEAMADRMLYDRETGDEYWEGIMASMESDYENWRRKNCSVVAFAEAPEEYEADNEEE